MSTVTLPGSREPAVVAVCLDWLHDSLPAPQASQWQATATSGFTTPRGPSSSQSWRPCEQCGGKGKTRHGPCGNCDGLGGWHFDPMDERRGALRTTADAHPEQDEPPRLVLLSSSLEAETERHAEEYPPTLRVLVSGLEQLREADRFERAMLQRVHIIRLDRLEALRPLELTIYVAALRHLTILLPSEFRAPRWARERAAERLRAPR